MRDFGWHLKYFIKIQNVNVRVYKIVLKQICDKFDGSEKFIKN